MSDFYPHSDLGYPSGYLESRNFILDYQQGLIIPFKLSIVDLNVDYIFSFTKKRDAALFYRENFDDVTIFCDLIVKHLDSWFIYLHSFEFKSLTDRAKEILAYSREFRFFNDLMLFNQLKNSNNVMTTFEKYLLLPSSGTWKDFDLNDSF